MRHKKRQEFNSNLSHLYTPDQTFVNFATLQKLSAAALPTLMSEACRRRRAGGGIKVVNATQFSLERSSMLISN